MTRSEIYELIDKERQYQDSKWGGETHDSKHKYNDWVAFITPYLGRATTASWSGTNDKAGFREAMIKVAALAVASIEADSK